MRLPRQLVTVDKQGRVHLQRLTRGHRVYEPHRRDDGAITLTPVTSGKHPHDLLVTDKLGRATIKNLTHGHDLYEPHREDDGTIVLIPVVPIPLAQMQHLTRLAQKADTPDEAA